MGSRLLRLWLNAGHAEHLPAATTTTWRVAFSFDASDADDFDPAEESVEEAARTNANAAVYAGDLPAEYAAEDWDPTFSVIYRVTGTLSEHREDLITFVGTHVEVRPRGDDDVFDYWPSGVRMAWDWACKLYAAGGPDVRPRVILGAQTTCIQLQGVLDYDELGLPERVPQL